MIAHKTATSIALIFALIGTLLNSATVSAEGTLEEIIVTARKKVETLQEAPLAISVLTASMIEDQGIQSIDDVATRTPGLSFHNSTRKDFVRPTFRGQASIIGDPNASFYIDGVYVNGTIATTALDNLERVEVMKGPQAVQFGRAAFAGAINYVTKNPTNEFEGKASITAGQDGDYRGSVSVSGPIIKDKLSFLLGVSADTFDGQYSALQTDGSTRDLGGRQTMGFDGMLYATPTDNLTIKLRVSHVESDDDNAPVSLDSTPLNFSVFDPVTNPYSPGYLRGVLKGKKAILENNCLWIEQASAADGDAVTCGVESEILRIHLVGEYEFFDGWTLIQSIAYNEYEDVEVYDGDYRMEFASGGGFNVRWGGEVTDRAYETRLASPADRKVRVQVGYYNYHEDENDPEFRFFTLAGIRKDPAKDLEDVKNQAYFGSVEVDVTDQLTASFEARYAVDERILNEGRPITIAAGSPEAFDVSAAASFHSFTPRTTLAWSATDNINTYVYAAKGNKPGGFNSVYYDPRLSAASFRKAQENGDLTIDEEQAWTYEIGAKTVWLENRLVFNVAAYYIDWENQGLSTSAEMELVDGSFQNRSAIFNLGKSEMKGLELDATWRATDQLTVSGTLAYSDAKIKVYSDLQQALLFDFQDGSIDYRPNFTATELNAFVEREGSVAGNQVPNSAEWQFSFSTVWEDQLGNTGWDWFTRADYQFESSRFAQIHQLLGTGDLRNLNLRLGVRNDKYTLTAWVTNATDDDTPTDISRQINFFGPRNLAGNFLRAFTQGLPGERQFGVTANMRF